MGIPAEHITESLMSNDHSGVYLFTGNFPVEIADHGEYHFRNFREEPSVVAEEHPQGFRKGWSEASFLLAHASSVKTEDLLSQMLGEEESPFLTAGEGKEIVVTTFRVTATDTGYTLPVITAGEKVLPNCLEPFEAKLPLCIGIFIIMPTVEIGEITL